MSIIAALCKFPANGEFENVLICLQTAHISLVVCFLAVARGKYRGRGGGRGGGRRPAGSGSDSDSSDFEERQPRK